MQAGAQRGAGEILGALGGGLPSSLATLRALGPGARGLRARGLAEAKPPSWITRSPEEPPPGETGLGWQGLTLGGPQRVFPAAGDEQSNSPPDPPIHSPHRPPGPGRREAATEQPGNIGVKTSA